MKHKIVVLDGHTLNPGDLSWEGLRSLGDTDVFDRTPDDQVAERTRDASIVITNKSQLTESVIAQLPKLQLIAVTATGYNVVDVNAALRHGAVVSNVPAYSTYSVAQHVFALLLSHLHAPARHHQAVLAGEWQRRNDFSFSLVPMIELAGKTFGIIGMGRIGQATAEVATALGMDVLAFSRTRHDHFIRDGFSWGSLEEVFEKADIVSLHCPLTDQNNGMVNQELLHRMKPSAILINTARGGLVNEQDLAEALNNNIISAALLDVTSSEPIKSCNPLLSAKNCLITPHIAWATFEARKRAMQVTQENVAAFINGQPINVVS